MSSAPIAGMLTAVETTPPVSAASDLLGALIAGAVGGLGRGGPEVRGDHDLGVAIVHEQRVVGHRLGWEHVERGARDLAGVERRLQRGVVDEPAAGDVEHAHAVAHLGERLGVEEAFGLGGLGQVDGDEVGLRVDVLGGVGLVDSQLAVALGADEGIEREHAHPEPARALGDELADAPEAEHAERLLVQLDAGVFRAVPFAFVQRLVRLGDVAGEREQQRQRVLGGGDDVRLGGVGDDDPAAGGGGHVDVVNAHARTADHAQVDGALDQLGGHLRGRTDQDPMVGADALVQFLFAPVDAEVDVKAGAQQLDARLADLLLDEDFQTLLGVSAWRSS